VAKLEYSPVARLVERLAVRLLLLVKAKWVLEPYIPPELRLVEVLA